ncbi:MAG: MDR family MFS transporter, partial [Gemmatimonadaceae bacterium]
MSAVSRPERPSRPRLAAHELTREQRALTLAGVLVSLMLAALDQTIVATAGPAIQRDLRIPPSLYPWITTSYLVASTVMVPIYGKLSDSFGRKPVLLVGVALFLVGSFLCGVAPSTLPLVGFRSLQGLGAAALITTAFAVIADLFPPAVRGKYMGLISAVMGIANVVGPLAGGFITDAFGWHWIFFVNLPLGGVALWLIAAKMPRVGGLARRDRPRVDVAGAVWLLLGLVPLLLALSLGHPRPAPGQWAWRSAPILAMLVVSVAALWRFVATERRAADPILRLEAFRGRVMSLGTAAIFLVGAGFLFAVIFLPLFLVNVVGVSATRAGVTMMPLTLGVVAGSLTAGQTVARLGRYKVVLVVSLALLTAGFLLMSLLLGPDRTQGEVTLLMLAIGVGVGPSLPLFPLVMQNASPPGSVGVTTAAATFARSLGGVIGVAVFGSIFAATLGGAVQRRSAAALAPLSPAARAVVARAAAGPGEAAAVSTEGG